MSKENLSSKEVVGGFDYSQLDDPTWKLVLDAENEINRLGEAIAQNIISRSAAT